MPCLPRMCIFWHATNWLKYYTSHTPLVAMSSWLPQPDLYCKIKANIIISKHYTTHGKNKKIQGKFITLELCKNLKSLHGWVGEKVDNGGHNKNNYLADRSMTYTQAPKVCEKNIFHLSHYTEPVINYSLHVYLKMWHHGQRKEFPDHAWYRNWMEDITQRTLILCSSCKKLYIFKAV